jgi:hypothetical protein
MRDHFDEMVSGRPKGRHRQPGIGEKSRHARNRPKVNAVALIDNNI